MKRPNFLLIGAQKCGTTALYDALRRHPQIYMSPVKEPFYFVLDGAPPPYTVPSQEYLDRLRFTEESYLQLFHDAVDQPAVGEASALYLSSYHPERTAARIHAFDPQMKLIALLRHPAERAWSAFHYFRVRGFEPHRNFDDALRAEANRGDEWSPDLRHWRNGCYFANFKPFYEMFPREQIRVYLYEDWNRRSQSVLQDVFNFLGVDDSVRTEPARVNVTQNCYSAKVYRFLETPNAARQTLEKFLHGRLRRYAYGAIRRLNRRRHPALDAKRRRMLTASYRSDIEQLQGLIDRDLSHWL